MQRIALMFFLAAILKIGAQVNLSSSLTGCYAMDGNAAEPINNLTGTLSIVTSTLGHLNTPGTALYFSGQSTSNVKLPNNPLLKPNQISFSAWVKVTVLYSNQAIVFTKNTLTNNFTAYTLAILNGKFVVCRQDNSNTDLLYSTTTVNLNTWYHVAFSMDNSTAKIYVNGAPEGSLSLVTSSFNYDPTRGVVLGGTNESFSNYFNGSIDNVRFYNRILNAMEVNALYTQDPACIPTPVSSFSVSPPSPCVGSSLFLTDQSSNTPTAWNWQILGPATNSSSASSPSLILQSPGTYTVSLTSSNNGGNGTTYTQTLAVLPLPTVSISGNSLACQGSTFNLVATGAASYTWNTGFAGSSLAITPINNVSYTVTATGNNGCTNTAVHAILVSPPPTVSISGPSLLCQGTQASFSVSGSAQSFAWNTGSNANPLVISPSTSTLYSVIGMSAGGCTNTAQISVTVNPAPSLSISGNSTICQGASTSLLVNGTAVTYSWSNGFVGNLVTVTPNISTVFTVTGTNSNSCEATATQIVLVNINPPVAAAANNNPVCLGDPLILSATGANTYTWTSGVTNGIAFYPTTTAVYTVVGTGTNSCKSTATIQVAIVSKPTLTVASSTSVTLCAGEPVVLSASGANSYSWSTGDITPMITITPSVNSSYTLTGIDVNGCKTSSVFVQNVNACSGIKEISANDLGIYPNPFYAELNVYGGKDLAEIKLEIYNSLGEQITVQYLTGPERSLSLDKQANGVYLIKVYTSDLLIHQQKVIKVSY